ncbi:MAG: hypothetical protein JSV50_02855, partial [Desulfobacteraceae bacterium]
MVIKKKKTKTTMKKPEIPQQFIRRYPRIAAHILAQSFGRATATMAAQVGLDALYRRENHQEWVQRRYKGNAGKCLKWSLEFRYFHRLFSANYKFNSRLVSDLINKGYECPPGTGTPWWWKIEGITFYGTSQGLRDDLERSLKGADDRVKPTQAQIKTSQYFINFKHGPELPIFGKVRDYRTFGYDEEEQQYISQVYSKRHMRFFRPCRCYSTAFKYGDCGHDVH